MKWNVGSSRTRKIDVRIFSATNAKVNEEVTGGRFRQDLLFRLNTIEIRSSAASGEKGGYSTAGSAFSTSSRTALSKSISGFEPAAMQALSLIQRQGNAERAQPRGIERAVLMAGDPVIRAIDLACAPAREGLTPYHRRYEPEEVESFLIRKALPVFWKCGCRAARALGLSRSALYRRLQRYGL